MDHEANGVRVRYFDAKPTLLQKTRLPLFTKSTIFRFGPEFGQWVQKNSIQYDVVNSHIAFTHSNNICSRAAKRHGKIYLYHQRGNLDPVRLRRGRLKKKLYIYMIEKPIMRRADALIALTERERASYLALGLKGPIAVIPNGIDASVFEKEVRPTDSTARVLAKIGEAPTFLWMSRVHSVKGPDIFVDAFIRCARSSPQVHALMAGPDESQLMRALSQRVTAAGLASRFHYVGLVAGDDKVALLRRADCFVLPTEAEGFSMVLLEAMAAGCAILTTEGACFRDLQDVGAGRILERHPDDFAEAMTELAALGRPTMRDMAENGVRLVRQAYSWTKIAVKYEELCRGLCARAEN